MEDKKKQGPIDPLHIMREKIDTLDREISLLLQQRLDCITQIAAYKKENQTQIMDRRREEKVIENVLSVLRTPEYAECLRLTYEGIMVQSRDFQNKRLSSPPIGTRRYALIGEKLSHSLSPRIHKLFFEKAHLDASYELKEVPPDQLENLLENLQREGFAGINITIPYKTDMMRYLHHLSEEALRIGAVNTVKIGEEYRGYNTDYHGFGMALNHHGFPVAGKSCAVLGSGGSSRAVISYLEDQGASQIVIVTRDPDEAGLKFPGLHCADNRSFTAAGFDLVVNTTPVGMSPHCEASPLSKNQLQGAGMVMDLIYNPRETLLLRYGKELGIPCANGMFMLVSQALNAQSIWQETEINPEIILEIYEELNRP